MSLAALALAVLVAQDGPNRHVPMLVQLEGPIEALVWDLGEQGSVTVRQAVPEGGSVPVLVPFPTDPGSGEVPVTGEPRTPERITLHPNKRPGWNRLAHGSRSVPPVPDASQRLGWPSLGALLATFLLVVGLRRLPAIALVPFAVGGALIATSLHEQARQRAAGHVRVLEGVGGSPAWVQVDVGAGWLDLAAEPTGTLEVVPTGAPVHWTVERPEGAVRDIWSVQGGTQLVRRVEALPGALGRGENDLVDLVDVRLRHGDGSWERLVDWRRGEPVPGPAPDLTTSDPVVASRQASPPGWLAAGLPQGVQVLVARVAPGRGLARSPRAGLQGSRTPDPTTWVRVVDLR